VALGKVVFTSREHIIALEARDQGMLGVTLRHPYEVRDQAEYFEGIKDEKIPKDMLDLALHIVETKRGDFNPEAFQDEYEDALKELIEKKAKGEKIETAKAPTRSNVVNLMDALRASVRRQPAPKGKALKRRELQRRLPAQAPVKRRRVRVAKSGEMNVTVECLKCGHVGVLTREALARFSIPRDAPLAAFVKRLRCRGCAVKAYWQPAKRQVGRPPDGERRRKRVGARSHTSCRTSFCDFSSQDEYLVHKMNMQSERVAPGSARAGP